MVAGSLIVGDAPGGALAAAHMVSAGSPLAPGADLATAGPPFHTPPAAGAGARAHSGADAAPWQEQQLAGSYGAPAAAQPQASWGREEGGGAGRGAGVAASPLIAGGGPTPPPPVPTDPQAQSRYLTVLVHRCAAAARLCSTTTPPFRAPPPDHMPRSAHGASHQSWASAPGHSPLPPLPAPRASHPCPPVAGPEQ